MEQMNKLENQVMTHCDFTTKRLNMPTVPTTNKDDAMRVTKCRYKKEFADKYIFRKVE